VRNQLRLKFIVPLILVAVAGLAVAKFVVLSDDSGEAEAAGPATTAAQVEPVAPAEETEPATTGEEAEEPQATGLTKLDAALEKKKVVVVVVYSPDGAVDTLQVSEARQGAADVKVGFLALNGMKEKEIADFATAYDVRTTPVVFVFRRGPEVTHRFDTVADRKTVAQAAQNARQAP
jgi:hypothetical protein